MENVENEWNLDNVKCDILNSIAEHVDSIFEYTREDYCMVDDIYIPLLHDRVEASIRKLTDDIAHHLEVNYRLSQDDTDYEKTDDRKTWHWILANFDNYGYSQIKSREDMLKLLFILEFNGENLDTLHDVGTMSEYLENEYCGIFGRWENDDEVIATLTDMFVVTDFKNFTNICLENAACDTVGRNSAEELTAEVLDELRTYFLWEVERGNQKYLKDGVVIDCRC